MQTPRTIFEQLSEAVASVLPVELAEDLRKNVKASLRSAFDQMDLVTREELEVQEAVLQRTREKVEQLEAQVARLEAELLRKSDTD